MNQDQRRIAQLVKLVLDGNVRGELKERFHREAKWILRSVARAIEIPLSSYKIHSNVAGPGVGGEVTLICPSLFLCMCADNRNLGVLYRRAKENDIYGVFSENHWIRWEELAQDFDACVRKIRHLMRHSESLIPAAIKR